MDVKGITMCWKDVPQILEYVPLAVPLPCLSHLTFTYHFIFIFIFIHMHIDLGFTL